ANATIFDGQGAVDAGFVDEVTTADQVMNRALEVAQDFADRLDPKAYSATVRSLRGGLLNEMDAAVASDRAAAGL
ncbi:MAG TPA: enoyl-CoA hydratase, partial [Acidimicrobiaceae bacterium]|nr:enoyl-CoA hydratase [Acidimicrobiaceae bacterium]